MCLIMPPDKDWIDLLSALTMPVIAIIGVYIAYQQRSINKNRLKHELFDRKYLIFEATKNFIFAIIKDPTVKNEDTYKFLTETKGALFIFEENIFDYLNLIHEKAIQLRVHEKKNEHDEAQKMYQWFNQQLIGIDQKFKDEIKIDA